MKRSVIDQTTMRFKVLKFGLSLHMIADNTQKAINAMDEDFRRSEELWNEMVSIDREFSGRLESLRCGAHDGYKQASARLGDIQMKFRSGDWESAQLKAQLKAERSVLWMVQKVNRKEADAMIDWKLLRKQRTRAIQDAALVENSKIRASAAGYIASQFDTACQRAGKEGRRVKHHAVDGSGVLAYRMRELGASVDGVDVTELFNDGRNLPIHIEMMGRDVLIGDPNAKLTEADKRRMRSLIMVRIRKDVNVYFTLHQHRQFRAGTIVKQFQLVAVREGQRIKHFICLTVMEPVAKNVIPTGARGMVGLSIGWNFSGTGNERAVALLKVSNKPNFLIDSSCLNRWRGMYVLQGKFQLMANDAIPLLKQHSKEFEGYASINPDDKRGRTAKYLLGKLNGKTMPTGLLLQLVKMADSNELSRELKDELLFWWRVDRMVLHHNERREALYDRWGNTRRKLINWRNDMYRNMAHDIVDGTSDIAVCAGGFANGDFSEWGLDMKPHTVFAVSTLQEFIKQKCADKGVDFYKISPPKSEKGESFSEFDVLDLGISKRNQALA